MASLEDCFIVGATYQELATRPLSAAELVKLPLLLLSPGSSTRTFVDQWFATKGLSVKPDIELGSVDLLAEFAGLGFGAAFITRSFMDEDLRSGKLYELSLADALPPRKSI